jgi:DNA-binding response OmpR family regulator
MHKQKILLVEDDANLGFVVKDNFEQEQFDVVLCTDGEQALQAFKTDTFDLCILDVMLPKMDGFELAKEIRKLNDQVPLLFLTAKSLKEDKLAGFTIGADDYITKPFSIEELILRCRVFIKRSKAVSQNNAKVITIGEYKFDIQNQLLIHETEQKKLTLRESLLLQLLSEKIDEIVKREYILKEVWGTDDYFAGRSMDVFISRLRKYLSKDPRIEIINYHSVGFKLFIQ